MWRRERQKNSEAHLWVSQNGLRNPCVLRSKNKNQRTRVSQNFAKQNEKLISAHYRLLAVMIHRRCPQNFAVRSSVRLAHKNLTWEIVVNAHYGFEKISAKSWAEKNLKIKNRRSNFLKANPWQILNTPKKFFVKGAGRQKFSQKIFSPLTKNFGVLFCQQGLLLKTSGHFFKCPNLLCHFENALSPRNKKPALPGKLQGGRVSAIMALAVGVPTPSANKSRGCSSEDERHFCISILPQNFNSDKASNPLTVGFWRVKFSRIAPPKKRRFFYGWKQKKKLGFRSLSRECAC